MFNQYLFKILSKMKKNCIFVIMVAFFFNISNAQTLTVTLTPTERSCKGVDATISTTVTGGTAPYTYLWSTWPVQTTPTAINLGGGPYTVTVTDALNNTGTATVALITENLTLNSHFPWTMDNTTGNQEILDMVYYEGFNYTIGLASGVFTIAGQTYNYGPTNPITGVNWRQYRFVFVVKTDYCGNELGGQIYGCLLDPATPARLGRYQIGIIKTYTASKFKIVITGNYDNINNGTVGYVLPTAAFNSVNDIFLTFLDPSNLLCSNVSDQLTFRSFFPNKVIAPDYSLGLSTDNNSVAFTGYFSGLSMSFIDPTFTLPPTTLTNINTNATTTDMFIARYDWSSTFNCPQLRFSRNNAPLNQSNDWGYHMVFAEPYIYYTSMNQWTTYNPAYVWQINSNDGTYITHQQIGGAGNLEYWAIADMAKGNGGVYICGYKQLSLANTASCKAFVAKYTGGMVWATNAVCQLAESTNPLNQATKIAVKEGGDAGSVIVSGTFGHPTDFKFVGLTALLRKGPISNQFAAKFSYNLTPMWEMGTLLNSSGTNGSSTASSVVYDQLHDMFYIAGGFDNTVTLNYTNNNLMTSWADIDAYVARFKDNGSSGYYLRQINPALLNDAISETNNELVKVYPNPSNGTFEMTTGNETTIDNIVISDITGRIVFKNSPINNVANIDLSNLSTGTYYSVILSNNKTTYKKLILIK